MKAVAMGAVAWMLIAAAIGVRAESRVALTVRLYNTSGISATEMLAARRAFEATFQGTGLELVFRHCGRRVSRAGPLDSCSEPLKPLEVVVRVINAPAFNLSLHPEAFGMAYLVRETDRGWLATVFSDRINGAATRVGVEAGRLLGLVIAHEVGHLLLGTGYHGAGVMRAEWPDDLIAHTSERFRFSSLEAARMRQAASTRF